MKLLIFIMSIIYFSAFGQQTECLNDPVIFTHFKSPIELPVKVLNDNKAITQHTGLKLLVNPDKYVNYDYSVRGVSLKLINLSDSVLNEKISCFDVKLICQLKDIDGNWINIEHPIKDPTCGWSIRYFDLKLNIGDYIEMVAPCYTGSEKVQMRYLLTLKDIEISSNEFEGLINKGLLN
ncbi:hypothetical protein OO013_07850 [Mangrovivirga sp. M17]|uniref:Uncharacterized protein n=1 Tax=Mangrovivirga halotolerans TaxID=2993936 RepID=A0ABT3RQY2_9BACT|nr:hypothetical protein [Mangrovivirga halotolerans]MCX2743773.1 hypothetical protein [Mangrovivirga halotolerans]